MTTPRAIAVALTVASLFASVPTTQAATGRIEGQVARPDGSGVSGVGVSIEGSAAFALTDGNGRFEFKGVRPRTYTLVFTLLDNTVTRPDVVVKAGSTTSVEQVVDWSVSFVETVTVRAVSRQRERLVDAPAAVTTILEDQIEREGSHALAPKLFEFTPGVDITQSSLFEFLVTTRGFNSTLNRRVPVLLDGRDLTDPFVGAMEWPTVALPLDDFDSVELLRGPSGALYGANATGGLVSLTTKPLRDSRGGQVRLAAGERSSGNLDFRWVGGLGGDWFVKAIGGLRRSDGYSVSRQVTTEYSEPCAAPGQTDCLLLDGVPFARDEIDIRSGGLRVDKYLSSGALFTLEGGTTVHDGAVFPTDFGRGQVLDVQRPWARFNFNTEHWNALAYFNRRDAETQNLTTGVSSTFDTHNWKVEFQTNWQFAGNAVRLVGGGSYFEEQVDSTAMFQAVDVDEQALFAQADWVPNEHLRLVGALRWDDSTLHDARISPRAAVVYSVNPRHVLRLSYNEGFQLPTYAELFVYAPIASLDLSSLEPLCAPIDCGFADGDVPGLILGNESLEVEETKTFEFGYRGLVGSKAFLTLELYDTSNSRFVSRLLPQLTPQGRTNPNFGPWRGPAPLPAGAEQDVRDEAAGLLPPGWELTNFGDSSVALALTLANFGEVDTRGLDLGLTYHFTDAWRLLASYTWFDSEIQKTLAGLEEALLPNAPENKASLGLDYVKSRWDVSLRGRWVDGFRWVNATYQGDVESFTTFDLSGNYALSDQWTVGLNVANLFDNDHWEAFGSDLLRRRALAHASFSW